MMLEKFIDELKEINELLRKLNETEFKKIRVLVDEVIKNEITDENTIGHVFDRMLDLDFIDECEIKKIYFKLLDYSKQINEDLSYDYKEFYDEKYNENEYEFTNIKIKSRKSIKNY